MYFIMCMYSCVFILDVCVCILHKDMYLIMCMYSCVFVYTADHHPRQQLQKRAKAILHVCLYIYIVYKDTYLSVYTYIYICFKKVYTF